MISSAHEIQLFLPYISVRVCVCDNIMYMKSNLKKKKKKNQMLLLIYQKSI